MPTPTTNYGLLKFAAGYSNWADDMNGNLDQIDLVLTSLAQDNAGKASFTFTQSTPSTTWVIVHNLNTTPSVTVLDSGGNWVMGQIHYDSLDQVTLTFSAAFGGTAYLT